MASDVAGSERRLGRAVVEIDALREQMLGYDPGEDRQGSIWDGLRIELDRRITVIRSAVESGMRLSSGPLTAVLAAKVEAVRKLDEKVRTGRDEHGERVQVHGVVIREAREQMLREIGELLVKTVEGF